MKRTGLMLAALGLFLFAQVAQAGWTPAKKISWTLGNSCYPAIAADSTGNLHVVWQDGTPGIYEIYYKNSTDGGTSWTVDRRLTWTSGWSENPALAIDSFNDIHLVWSDNTPGQYEIYYKKGMKHGAIWTTAKRLTWTSGDSEHPSIAVDSLDNLYVVWEDDSPGNHEIYYKRSTDGGGSWTADGRLTWTLGLSENPALAVDSFNDIHLVWSDYTPGQYEIYYKKGMKHGATWTTAKRLTWTSGDSEHPSIAADPSDKPHVVWEDNTPGNYEIYYKGSTDMGTTWAPNWRFTWTSDDSLCPAIAADSSGNLHAVWYDKNRGNFEIYYNKSTDGGTTWSPNKRLTWTPSDSRYPDITDDPSCNLHVVWCEGAPGSIYYKKYVK
jgi:hypothetical protein